MKAVIEDEVGSQLAPRRMQRPRIMRCSVRPVVEPADADQDGLPFYAERFVAGAVVYWATKWSAPNGPRDVNSTGPLIGGTAPSRSLVLSITGWALTRSTISATTPSCGVQAPAPAAPMSWSRIAREHFPTFRGSFIPSGAIRLNNSAAGSSAASCGTSLPRMARSRMNRRRRGTASGGIGNALISGQQKPRLHAAPSPSSGGTSGASAAISPGK